MKHSQPPPAEQEVLQPRDLKTLATMVIPVQTSLFRRRQNLLEFVCREIPSDLIQERMVVAVTSKIVSLAEDRVLDRSSVDKEELVRREADLFLGEIGYGCFLTIKEGLFIASAGIDESNAEDGTYILFPENPTKSAHELWTGLRKSWNLKELGIILTDSHTSPLRQGVTGVCLSYWGFHGVRDRIGTPDLFGRSLKMTKMNLADGLAGMAVMVMGEGNESQPLAVISGAPIEFCDEVDSNEIRIPLEQDLYYPLIQNFKSDR
jgi:dihydrofolate synthase / folylpolyglutamate synthase